MKKLILFALLALALVPNAQGSISTFSGVDNTGATLGPNSIAARNSWELNVASYFLIDFESLAVGTLSTDPYTPVAIGNGVNANFNGSMDSAVTGVKTGGSAALGFNTTSGGQNILQFGSQFNPASTPGLNMTFLDPIYGWGAYITGLEPDIAGVLHLLFNDGTAQDLSIPDGVIGGSSQFFGFITTEYVSSLNFELLGVNTTRDIFAFDDVVYASTVPEPSTFLLLGGGLIGLAFAIRRRRKE